MTQDETLDGPTEALPRPDASTGKKDGEPIDQDAPTMELLREARDSFLETDPGPAPTPGSSGAASPSSDPLPGLGESAGLSHDRYRLGPILGEGGMGQVFAALDTSLQRNVAVKIVHDDLADRPGLEERLEEEARILASLDAPGALPIYDSGRMEGRSFYAMKWVKGSTLTELLRQRDAHRVRDRSNRQYFLSLFERICRAMAAVHGEGVVHRDLKPDNVMVDDFGAVHVMDWGLAKRFDDASDSSRAVATVAGQVLGTPGFMSPEQAEGHAHSAGPETDVFALGVILYQILTGQRPFWGKDREGVLRATLDATPRAPRKHVPSIPRPLEAICLKALAADAADRYPTAGDLVRDLRRFQEHRRVLAHRPTPPERLISWARRRPAWAAGISIFLLVLLLVGTIRTTRVATEREWIDMASAAMSQTHERLTETRARLDELEEGSKAGIRERAMLEARAEQLEESLGRQTWALLGLSLGSISELGAEDGPWLEAQRLIREQVFRNIDRYLAENRPYRALALVDQALESSERGNVHGFGEEDLARLRTSKAELKARVEAGE